MGIELILGLYTASHTDYKTTGKKLPIESMLSARLQGPTASFPAIIYISALILQLTV